MKLIRFGKKGKEKPGVEVDGQRLDCSAHFEDWNNNFFQKKGLSKLEKLIKKQREQLPIISNKVRLGSPIVRPGAIICIGLNYADHAKEAGKDIPKEPLVFMKATNTISGPNDAVPIPKASKKVDWEIELGIVIGKNAAYLKDEKAAAKAIAGYTLVHDVSERHFQLERGGQWVKGKSCAGFCPVGPYLVLKKNIQDVLNLKMFLNVNGKRRQTGNTKHMIFNPSYIVWYLSQFMQLEAGDLISTGTPAGVAIGMKRPKYLKAGDKVELGIEGLGGQRQQFIIAKSS